jgi:hypothetical protein
MYDKPSDIDATFSKWESHIVTQQCRMPMRQTVCFTLKTPAKMHVNQPLKDQKEHFLDSLCYQLFKGIVLPSPIEPQLWTGHAKRKGLHGWFAKLQLMQSFGTSGTNHIKPWCGSVNDKKYYIYT